MDENSWKIIQIIMWILGIQTAFLTIVMGFIWVNLSWKVDHLELELKGLQNKVEDIDKRLCRIEGSLAS